MDHRSLYRTHRPQTFADVVGQAHITETLARAVDEGQIHHAYLFTGPRGTGKTSTARILAKALNCAEGPTAVPCNACSACVGITEGNHVDVVEIDAASHGGVDDVRDLRDRVAFAPAAARTKVYIVDECHMLSTAGWNAFLKTVEEPPGHVVFVFATTEPHKVLDTILSRTQRFDFRRVGPAALAAHLDRIAQQEGLRLDPGARDQVVRAGDGSVRDTLSVLEQVRAFVGDEISADDVNAVLGAVGSEVLGRMVDALAAGDAAAACQLVADAADGGVDLRQFARDAVEHLRRLLLLAAAPQAQLVEATDEELAELRRQADAVGTAQALRTVELLAEAQAQMRRGNIRLPLEIALLKAVLPDASARPAPAQPALSHTPASQAAPARSAPSGPAPSEPDPSGPAPAQPAPAQPTSQEPAPSTPAPAAEEPAGAATAGITLQQVQQCWPAILEAVKARKRTVHAWLNEARPVGVDGSVLRLELRAGYSFHAEQLATERSQQVVGEVLEEQLGRALALRCRVADDDGEVSPAPAAADDPDDGGPADSAGEAPTAEVSEAPEAAGGDTAEAHQQAVERLQQQLGATIVDDTRW